MVPKTLREDCTGPQTMLVLGRLRGYRWFNYDPRSPIGIGSARKNRLGRSLPWQPVMQARCYHALGERWRSRATCSAPQEACSCGLYAWYTPWHLRDVIGIDHENAAFGVVEADGDILTGSKGFRAQKMRVVALCYLRDHASQASLADAGIMAYVDHRQMLSDWPVAAASEIIDYDEPTADERFQSEISLEIAWAGELLYRTIRMSVQALVEARERVVEVKRRPLRYPAELIDAEARVHVCERRLARARKTFIDTAA